jgi:predicted DsbA family dithiol-disulfide isomerase
VNIARNQALISIAEKMPGDFDVEQFTKDLLSGAGKPAFRRDLEEVRINQVSRFPTITLKTQRTGLIITGFKNFDYLSEALRKII